MLDNDMLGMPVVAVVAGSDNAPVSATLVIVLAEDSDSAIDAEWELENQLVYTDGEALGVARPTDLELDRVAPERSGDSAEDTRGPGSDILVLEG